LKKALNIRAQLTFVGFPFEALPGEHEANFVNASDVAVHPLPLLIHDTEDCFFSIRLTIRWLWHGRP